MRHQAITWANIDPVLCCPMIPLSHKELIKPNKLILSEVIFNDQILDKWYCTIWHQKSQFHNNNWIDTFSLSMVMNILHSLGWWSDNSIHNVSHYLICYKKEVMRQVILVDILGHACACLWHHISGLTGLFGIMYPWIWSTGVTFNIS